MLMLYPILKLSLRIPPNRILLQNIANVKTALKTSMLLKSSLCSLYNFVIIGLAYMKVNIKATITTTIINAGLIILIVNAAINNNDALINF